MTTVRATIRSEQTQTADGHDDIVPVARAAAISGLDLAGAELVQANTVSSKASGDVTIRAVARSSETRELEVSGANYESAVAALRAQVPEGWQALSIVVTVD